MHMREAILQCCEVWDYTYCAIGCGSNRSVPRTLTFGASSSSRRDAYHSTEEKTFFGSLLLLFSQRPSLSPSHTEYVHYRARNKKRNVPCLLDSDFFCFPPFALASTPKVSANRSNYSAPSRRETLFLLYGLRGVLPIYAELLLLCAVLMRGVLSPFQPFFYWFRFRTYILEERDEVRAA